MITEYGNIRESRKQVLARREHVCDICGKTIKKRREYIACSRQETPGGGWADYKYHVHCDALLRFCAEKTDRASTLVTANEMRGFVDFLCDTECINGLRNRCGNEGFSCPQILNVLRNRPGYHAILKSATDNAEGGAT